MGLVTMGPSGTGTSVFAPVTAQGIPTGGKTGTAQKEVPEYDPKTGEMKTEKKIERDRRGNPIREYEVPVLSPEKRSGKTRALEVLELLTPRAWRIVQPSTAVLFRKIEKDHPTLLLDEADAIVINTCGFLEASKEESLKEIREAQLEGKLRTREDALEYARRFQH